MSGDRCSTINCKAKLTKKNSFEINGKKYCKECAVLLQKYLMKVLVCGEKK